MLPYSLPYFRAFPMLAEHLLKEFLSHPTYFHKRKACKIKKQSPIPRSDFEITARNKSYFFDGEYGFDGTR